MPIEKKLGKATRDAYGEALVNLGKENNQIVVLDADLSKSTKTGVFAKQFPDRFFNCGICEANMVGIAGGLALSGKIPFVSSFACFVMCKAYDQLRMAVAFPETNVKIVASHGGISIGEDGTSQQSIEDLALATSLPNFQVMVPADEFATRALVRRCAEHSGPIYMRTGRPKFPILYGEKQTFEIGKAIQLRKGRDLSIVACGLMVFEALVAAETLEQRGISTAVWDMHTLKPLDEAALQKICDETPAIVTAEEHQIWGGLGSAVSRWVAQNHPTPMAFVAIQDTYAESGTPEELLEKYGLTASHIVTATEQLLKKKVFLAEARRRGTS